MDWGCTSHQSTHVDYKVLSSPCSQSSVNNTEGHTSHLSVSDEPEDFPKRGISTPRWKQQPSTALNRLFCLHFLCCPTSFSLLECHSTPVWKQFWIQVWTYHWQQDLKTAPASMHIATTHANGLFGRIPKCHYPTAQLKKPKVKKLYWFLALTPTQIFCGHSYWRSASSRKYFALETYAA